VKPGPIHKLKTKKVPQTQTDQTKKKKNPECVYLKFLTPSVEKTVNLHGFK